MQLLKDFGKRSKGRKLRK